MTSGCPYSSPKLLGPLTDMVDSLFPLSASLTSLFNQAGLFPLTTFYTFGQPAPEYLTAFLDSFIIQD